MQRFLFVMLLLLAWPTTRPGPMIQAAEEIRLIVRGDDLGSSHAADDACIQSYKEGIMRTVELMVPGPWFPEAVKMLNENPGLDVGIHLVLTSEWANMKWRPLSCVPTLVDADGYFFPMVWQNPNFPPKTSIQKSSWKLDEVEKELRTQIETALRHVPRISHLGCHMGCTSLDSSMASVENKLAKEYHLEWDYKALNVKLFQGWRNDVKVAEERIRQFVQNLELLQPGTYLFIEHPGLNVPEMQALGHKGYEEVATDRDAVTRVFTSKEVQAAVQRKGIRLVSYKDVKEGR
jgi:predicted glycoside hydrolase/deacetylase ChbG (UPF0249 family)